MMAEIQQKSGARLSVGMSLKTVQLVGSNQQIQAAKVLVNKVEAANKNFPPPDEKKKARWAAQFPALGESVHNP